MQFFHQVVFPRSEQKLIKNSFVDTAQKAGWDESLH